MPPRNHPKRPGPRIRPIPRGREWVGGRMVTPFYVTEGAPYRPEMTLWLELPDDLIVYFQADAPGDAELSFGDTLLAAMKSPLIGPPRQPRTVRVADAALAAEVRRLIPEIRVIEAPTPELDDLLAQMAEASSRDEVGEEPSYLEAGRVSVGAVGSMFRAADALYKIAPWKSAGDGQILRVDIPAYEVDGACLSIVGALGRSTGLILFPSIEGFEEFVEAVQVPPRPSEAIDLGTTTLALNYESGSDLPPEMYREALSYGWPVASVEAFPVVQHRDRDGLLRPLSEQDVLIMTACAAALAAFFPKHRRRFERDALDAPVSESFFNQAGVEVRITAPYMDDEFFEEEPPYVRPKSSSAGAAGAPVSAGRDEDPPSAGAGDVPASVHDLDGKLVSRIDRYARERFGPRWMAGAAGDFHRGERPDPLAGPWSFWGHAVEGKPVADWYLEERGDRLSERERTWMEAQRAAWLSVWEVVEVEPGLSVTLRDLLTDETRLVRERSASQSLSKRWTLLARVVDHEGISVLCGLHSHPLSPQDADRVVEEVRRRLRRRSAIPVDRMREERIGSYLIKCWEDALDRRDAASETPRVLQNTDGDPLLVTVDHFAFARADRAEIERRLAAAEGVQAPPEPGDPEPVYVFTRPGNPMHRSWENTTTGRAVISGGMLHVETNSVNRADALRQRLEALLVPLVRHRAREHADPMAALREGDPPAGSGAASSDIPDEERDRVIREMKARHYATWADHPMPALGGKTPREAMRTKSGRRQVDLLLRQGESLESGVPEGQRFDFGVIRRELGLAE